MTLLNTPSYSLNYYSNKADNIRIDGVKSYYEWKNATEINFTISYTTILNSNETHDGKLYILNDYKNIYFCVIIFQEDYNDLDELTIFFDIGNDLVRGDGEIKVVISAEPFGYSIALFRWNGPNQDYDCVGGSSSAKVIWIGASGIGNYTFEFAVPFSWIKINSGDYIRFTLHYYDWDGLKGGYFPSADYQNFIILQTTYVEPPIYETPLNNLLFWILIIIGIIIFIIVDALVLHYGNNKIKYSTKSLTFYKLLGILFCIMGYIFTFFSIFYLIDILIPIADEFIFSSEFTPTISMIINIYLGIALFSIGLIFGGLGEIFIKTYKK